MFTANVLITTDTVHGEHFKRAARNKFNQTQQFVLESKIKLKLFKIEMKKALDSYFENKESHTFSL